MPAGSSCFSNPADVPPVIGNRNAAQSARSGLLNCFSYPADVPAGTRTRNAAQSAQYGWLSCFSYPTDVPPDIGNRSVVRPVRDSKLCFSYTVTHCFRY